MVLYFFFLLETDRTNNSKINLYVRIVNIITNSDIYKLFSLILFVCLTSLASMSVHCLTEEVKIWYSSIHGVSSYRINRWQKIYFTILDLIMEIDRFFGPMAVIIITYVFIQTIINVSVAIEILLGLLEGDLILFFLKNFKNMIMILGFIFGNEIIKRKVLERLIISYRIFNN